MQNEQDEQRELKALLDRLDAVYAEFEAQKPKADFIELTVKPSELLSLMIGLVDSIQCLKAKKYINESLGTGISSEHRWSTFAEILLIKGPGEKVRPHGVNELIDYWVRIEHGFSPRKASEEVFKKYKFLSQEACDKWLRREIERRQREQQNGVPDFLAELPKPGTSPREK